MLPARTVYGLGLQSNVPLAALRASAVSQKVDITLTFGEIPAGIGPGAVFYRSEETDERGIAAVSASRLLGGAYYRLEYADETCVVLDCRGEKIWVTAPPAATIEDTAAYILGPALGFALRLRGITCLHASAIAHDAGAVAFVGCAGAGKSTLAAAFARRGHAVLTDDVAPLCERGDGYEIVPAYPRLRLWPESVEFLFGTPDALPRISPTWDKRFLGLDGNGFEFAHSPLPLTHIFLLAPRIEHGIARVESMSPREAMVGLVGHTYTGRLPDPPARASEFGILGRVAASVPVHRVVASQDPARIDDLCDAIENRLARKTARAA